MKNPLHPQNEIESDWHAIRSKQPGANIDCVSRLVLRWNERAAKERRRAERYSGDSAKKAIATALALESAAVELEGCWAENFKRVTEDDLHDQWQDSPHNQDKY